jgi:hypothetical protein
MNTLTPSKSNEELLASLGVEVIEAPEVAIEPSAPSNHYSPGISSSVEERALALLGSGVGSDSVASALGVTPGRISQMLAEKSFSSKVSDLRYKALQSHNVRDGKYDSLEDNLIIKLERAMPLLVRPRDIIDALTKVNNAKRRGQSAPPQVNNQQNIVNLILPNVIADKFSIDINNQVVKAGEQELLTMPSGNLLKQVEEAQAASSAGEPKQIE